MFICCLPIGSAQRPAGIISAACRVGPLVLFDDQRHFRAGGPPVASQLLILGPHLVLFEDRIARVVDWKQVWIDGVALGMTHAFGLFETNPHKLPSLERRCGMSGIELSRQSVKSRRSFPAKVGLRQLGSLGKPRSTPLGGLVSRLAHMRYWWATRRRWRQSSLH